jgi:hypothetical protein
MAVAIGKISSNAAREYIRLDRVTAQIAARPLAFKKAYSMLRLLKILLLLSSLSWLAYFLYMVACVGEFISWHFNSGDYIKIALVGFGPVVLATIFLAVRWPAKV